MKSQIGSTVTIVVGVLSIVAGLNNMANNKQDSNFLLGIVMVLGGLAYRSVKRRNLLETTNSSLRKIGEASLLAIMLAAVLMQNNLWLNIAYKPVPNIIAPVWVLVAYAIIALKRQKTLPSSRLKPHLHLVSWLAIALNLD